MSALSGTPRSSPIKRLLLGSRRYSYGRPSLRSRTNSSARDRNTSGSTGLFRVDACDSISLCAHAGREAIAARPTPLTLRKLRREILFKSSGMFVYARSQEFLDAAPPSYYLAGPAVRPLPAASLCERRLSPALARIRTQ